MTDTSSEPRKVITVTLNPALDRILTTNFLSLGNYNRSSGPARLDPAGRGVSISRGLHALGTPTHAVILVGQDATGRAYQALLAEEQYPITILRRAGRTRSNIHIQDTGHNHHTVIMEDSDEVVRADRQAVANALVNVINPHDTVVFAGSLPPGVRTDIYAALTSLAQTKGAAVALNAGGGEPLEKALQARPTLIYLTQTQAERLFNFPVRALEDVLYCANQLRKRSVRRVLIGMEQAEVAFLVTQEGAWVAHWPEVAGDKIARAEALIAGYLAGRLEGASFEDALKLAAATAAYTVSQVGSEFGMRQEINALLPDIAVHPADTPEDLIQAQDHIDAAITARQLAAQLPPNPRDSQEDAGSH